MGVHISFVRSTNLDSWQLAQLRNMKVGGNAFATEFFTKHGGASLLNDADTKKKYSSRVAELYKEELAKRVKDDVARFPNGIVLDGVENVATPTPKEQTEDDFFESWSKPSTPKPSAPATPRVSTPPIIGTPSPAQPASTPSSSAPRTITSSAASRANKLGSSRLNSASSTSSTSSAAKKSRLGLGASKAKPVDFAEAERKALEEAERVRQLGYDRQREEEEEKAKKEAAAAKTALEIGPTKGSGSTTTAVKKPNPAAEAQKAAAFPRLGFGAVPGTGAANLTAAANSTRISTSSLADDSPTTARDKFGNQKAISSDMFFGRNAYDPAAVSEAQTRLQSFQGATSISSNQYFGREEEEEMGMGRRGDEGLLGDGSLAGLEVAARDALNRVLANPDVQNVGESIRTGALKLSDYLAQMSERG